MTSLKIAKIRGVDLKLHVSLIFLILYVIFVSAIDFPQVVSQSGIDMSSLTIGPWLAGAVFAFGLLLSIALHEFGHVLVAQTQGVSVKGVTLMVLGGVSEMGKIPEQPYAEFKLAVIGPLVSLGIWAFLSGVGNISNVPEIGLFSYWLGSANLVLAIFNLLPAFPLDGGRALRSILVAKQGALKGTENAVRVSQVFAWLFGIFGFIYFNFLLVLVAIFIYSAAKSEWALLVTRDLFKKVLVSEVMRRIHPLVETATLDEALSSMLNTKTHILPVQRATGEPALIDLSSFRGLERGKLRFTLVADYLQAAPKSLQVNEEVSNILVDVLTSPLQALPVEETNQVVGVLHYRDLTDLIQLRSAAGLSSESPLEGKKAA